VVGYSTGAAGGSVGAGVADGQAASTILAITKIANTRNQVPRFMMVSPPKG
jgi:hypothetical protein